MDTHDYVLIELQKDFDGNLGNIVTALPNKTPDQAKSDWHSVCATAALSSIHKHTVLLLNDQGDIAEKEIYIRERQGGNNE